MRRGYADTRLGQLSYLEAGAGEPVVLLHKSPSNARSYEPILPLLAAERRAIALETPGFGRSDGPERPPGTLRWYADAVLAALDALGIERCSLVGHHAGANIALTVAAVAPERVDALVLAGLVLIPDADERRRWSESMTRFELDVDGAFLQQYPLPLFRTFMRFVDGEHYLRELIAALEAGPRYWWLYDALFAEDIAPALARVPDRTLLINARDDTPAVVAGTRQAAELVPRARYVELDGTGEIVAEHPAAFADAIRGLLDDDRR